MPRSFVATSVVLAAAVSIAAQPRPSAVWSDSRVQAVLERTARTRLSPDLTHLSKGEHAAVNKLLEVGAVFQDVYEQQRHRNALSQRAALARATDSRSRHLLTLYRLNAGPIATTLENAREPFLAVDAAPPGKNVYPWDLTEKEFQTYVAAHPEARPTLTHLRHVVRRADAASLTRDLGVLTKHRCSMRCIRA